MTELTETTKVPMNPEQIKQFEERQQAWEEIKAQWPKLLELKDQLANDPNEFRRMYPILLVQAVAETLDIPPSGVTILGGKPYINKTGLSVRLQKDERRVKVKKTVPVLYPMEIKQLSNPSDEDMKKYFIGCSTDGTAVYRAIIEFEDGSIYEEEGSAHPNNIKMSTMKVFVMELAATRAMNRAMRSATGVGLVSIEELNERGFSLKGDSGNDVSGKKIELVGKVEKLFTKLKFNSAKKLQFTSKFAGVPDLVQASEVNLEKLLYTLQEIVPKKLPKPKKTVKKKVEKKTEPKKAVEEIAEKKEPGKKDVKK